MGNWGWASLWEVTVYYRTVVAPKWNDSPDSINWCKVVWWSEIDEEKQIALFVITQDLNKDKNDSEWPDTGEYYLSKCFGEALNVTVAWHCESSINVTGQEQNQGRRTSLFFLRSSLVCSKAQGNMSYVLIFWDPKIHSTIFLYLCLSLSLSVSFCLSFQFNKSLLIIYYGVRHRTSIYERGKLQWSSWTFWQHLIRTDLP